MKKTIILLTVGIVMILLLGGSGYYLLSQKPEEELTSPLQLSPTPLAASPTLSPLQMETELVLARINEFYEAYQSCEASPPAAARGRVSTYCQANTGFTTETFTQNIKERGIAGRGADPITCSQNPPVSVAAESIDFEDPVRSVGTVVATYGGSFAQKISVVTVKEEDDWMIENVICPKP